MAGRRVLACRFLPAEGEEGIIGAVADALDELEESDVWGPHVGARQLQDERSSSKPRRNASGRTGGSRVAAARSVPVNVPDWSKILGHRPHGHGGRRGGDEEDEDEEDEDEDEEGADVGGRGGGRVIPPHEYLWRQRRRSGVASMSVHEGIGRTLKGRDLSRVRNAVWEKIGFQD